MATTKEQPEIRVYAVGTQKAQCVLFATVNGNKWVFPTDLKTMAILAEIGVPFINEF